MKYLVLILSVLVSLHSYASTCPDVKVCFTSGGDCTKRIVDTLSEAKESILIQDYEFTSKPIVNRVIAAKRRDIEIQLIKVK